MEDSQHSLSRGEHYLVAAGFIYSQGLALVARRALSKSIAPGRLHLPGGHVEAREHPAAALRREIDEEFGVQVQVTDPLHTFENDEHGRHTSVAYRRAITAFPKKRKTGAVCGGQRQVTACLCLNMATSSFTLCSLRLISRRKVPE